MTKEMFDCIPEIDFDSGNRYFLGNMDNYKQALLSILKSVKAKQPLLQSIYMSNEYDGLRMIMQTLSRMFHNVGALQLSELSYEIEYLLLNDVDSLDEELKQYIDLLQEFSDHLEELFQRMNLKAYVQPEAQTFVNYDFTKTKESIKLSNRLLNRKVI